VSCGSEPVVKLWSPEAEHETPPDPAQREILLSNMMEVGRSQRLNRNLLGFMQVGPNNMDQRLDARLAPGSPGAAAAGAGQPGSAGGPGAGAAGSESPVDPEMPPLEDEDPGADEDDDGAHVPCQMM
jgi:hypothetical protein